jgi:hypothetical protein
MRRTGRHGDDVEDSHEDLPAPLVRDGGRGGGPVLRLDLSGFPRGTRVVAPERVAERAAGSVKVVTDALLKMVKLDIAALEKAYHS